MILGNHELDLSSLKKYDETLSNYLKVTIIEEVNNIGERDSTKAKEEKCIKRETFWQRQLKTLTTYGGLNIRNRPNRYTPNA